MSIRSLILSCIDPPLTRPAAGAVLALGIWASGAAAAMPAYSIAGTFGSPGGAWDVGPDGRLVALSGTSVLQQVAVNGSAYTNIGSVPAGTTASFGASFVSLSPDGSTLAIGDNVFAATGRVHMLNTAALNTSLPTPTVSVIAPNYAAAWSGSSTLYVSGGGGPTPTVTRIDGAASGSPASTIVIDNIGDGSGGVAIRSGRLYTGIGFDTNFITDGTIRSFGLPSLSVAAAAVPFASGAFEAQILSASTLDFDALGNIIVGGFGSVAVVNLGTSERLDLAPNGPFGFYSGRYNAATGEILVTDFNVPGDVYRYAIPAPGMATMMWLGGLLAWRRRRAGTFSCQECRS